MNAVPDTLAAGLPEAAGGSNRVHVDQPLAAEAIAAAVRQHLAAVWQPGRPLVILCIGTDRSTGDALGPLIGTELQRAVPAGVHVLGTLDEPVHAANLADALAELDRRYARATVLAVDACLGKAENVGCVSVKAGPLRPGTGVHKRLPAVGDLHVIGVVNVGGFMEYFVLQNTRLSLVMRMASTIARGLLLALDLLAASGGAREDSQGRRSASAAATLRRQAASRLVEAGAREGS